MADDAVSAVANHPSITVQLGGKLFTQQRSCMENFLTLPLNQCADGNQEN